MSDFKFEYELNPVSRRSAALDNEGQRIRDELEKAKASFRAQLQRVIAGAAIMSALLIVGRLYVSHKHISPVSLLVSLFAMVAFSLLRGKGGVARLVEFGRNVLWTQRQLADWNAIRHEVSLSFSDGSVHQTALNP